jgi:hypothetical protein
MPAQYDHRRRPVNTRSPEEASPKKRRREM